MRSGTSLPKLKLFFEVTTIFPFASPFFWFSRSSQTSYSQISARFTNKATRNAWDDPCQRIRKFNGPRVSSRPKTPDWSRFQTINMWEQDDWNLPSGGFLLNQAGLVLLVPALCFQILAVFLFSTNSHSFMFLPAFSERRNQKKIVLFDPFDGFGVAMLNTLDGMRTSGCLLLKAIQQIIRLFSYESGPSIDHSRRSSFGIREVPLPSRRRYTMQSRLQVQRANGDGNRKTSYQYGGVNQPPINMEVDDDSLKPMPLTRRRMSVPENVFRRAVRIQANLHEYGHF